MAKQTKNLSLDVDAVRRAERYSERHGISVSQLVSNYLSSLPIDAEDSGLVLSPAVRRLSGIAIGGTDPDDYHRHLVEKYGS